MLQVEGINSLFIWVTEMKLKSLNEVKRERYNKLCIDVMKKLNIGKTRLAEDYLEIDTKTARRYGDGTSAVPDDILKHLLELVSDEPASVVEQALTEEADSFFDRVMKRLLG